MSCSLPRKAKDDVRAVTLRPATVRQQVDDLLGQAVAEVLVVRIAAHVGERQHGDGWDAIAVLDHV
jgi:hypothetical protein